MWNRAANSSWLRRNALRMTFTCGTRFIRLKSSGVSGCASESARAAAWRSSSLIASARLQSCRARFPLVRSAVVFMVLASLMGLGKSSRADANSAASVRVGHEQNVILYHADGNIAVLSIVFAVVNLNYGKRIVEYVAGHFEGDTMLSVVGGGLCIMPFEIVGTHCGPLCGKETPRYGVTVLSVSRFSGKILQPVEHFQGRLGRKLVGAEGGECVFDG